MLSEMDHHFESSSGFTRSMLLGLHGKAVEQVLNGWLNLLDDANPACFLFNSKRSPYD